MRLGFLLLVLLGLGSSVRAQSMPERVDFSKPPSEVEAYNKVRFAVRGERTAKGLVLTVEGEAYYPDGAVIKIALRYWKQTRYLTSWKVKVEDRQFRATLRPVPRRLPGGALTVEAWFALAEQTPETKRAMKDGGYFSCSPP
ncbi:MAG: hypothetical protein D6731_23955 [Planctomycetota bacterium]|nr:MAG: hypothetical protein D6731_23955 [Planctomycetota bacterium]